MSVALLTGPSNALALPRGIKGRAVGTGTTFTTTAGPTLITVTSGDPPSLELELDTSRQYKMVFEGRFGSTVANDHIVVVFYAGATQHRAYLLNAAINAQSIHLEELFTSLTDAPTIYQIRLQRASGTGTIGAQASPTTPLDFYIEDVGVAL